MDWDGIEALSMACPALPMCGLAIAEAERGLPDVNARIRALLTKLGVSPDEKFVVRMTGERGLVGVRVGEGVGGCEWVGR